MKCRLCGGTGWRPGKTVQHTGSFAGTTYIGVGRCSCNRVQVPAEEQQIKPTRSKSGLSKVSVSGRFVESWHAKNDD